MKFVKHTLTKITEKKIRENQITNDGSETKARKTSRDELNRQIFFLIVYLENIFSTCARK